jgi:thioesterase domain-containing protein
VKSLLINNFTQTTLSQIPAAEAMGISVESFDGNRIRLKAPLHLNKNPHETGFAGSLYTLCALSGWSLLTLSLMEKGLFPSIVLKEGRIRYAAPVKSNIVSSSALPPGFFKKIRKLKNRGKSELKIKSFILENEKTAVSFTGIYSLKIF